MSSVEQYPDLGYFLIVDSSTLQLGSYTGLSGILNTAHLRVYNKNASSFTYTLQLKVSTSEGGYAVASSNIETFSSTAVGQTSTDWLFDLTFTFSGYEFLSTETYYLSLVTTGYTKNANTTYMGVWCDWLEPIGPDDSAAARIAFGVLR